MERNYIGSDKWQGTMQQKWQITCNYEVPVDKISDFK